MSTVLIPSGGLGRKYNGTQELEREELVTGRSVGQVLEW